MAEDSPQVEVVYALPDRQRVVTVALPAQGLTARAALEQSGLTVEFPEILGQPLVLGVFGDLCAPDRLLRAGDRLEVYRPLRNDPRATRSRRVASTPRKGWKR